MTAAKTVVAVVVAAAARVAHAAPPEAIEVDRDDEPPGQPELSFDAGAPVGDYAAMARAQVLDEPIALRDGDTVTYPVDHRETLTVGGAVTLGARLVVDAALPLDHQVGARLTGVPALGDDGALAHWAGGDLRAGVRLRLSGGVFVRGELAAPTGDDRDFAGAGGWTYGLHLIGRLVLGGGVIVAGTAGVRLRQDEVQLADRIVGNELDGAVGVIVPLPPVRPLWCGKDQVVVDAELDGVIGDDVNGVRGPSPVEAKLGMVSRLPWRGLQVGARLGFGLDDEIGAPSWRAMVEVSWHHGAVVAPPEPVHERVPDDDDMAVR